MSDALVFLDSFSNRVSADLTKSLLENAGFHVFIKSDDAGGMEVGLTYSNGVHIYVLQSEREEALAFLNSFSEVK